MNKNLENLLEKLAEQLGTTTEYLWSVLLTQAYYQAWFKLIFLIIALFGVIICIKGIFKCLDPEYDYTEIKEKKILHFFVYLCLGLILLFSTIFSLIEMSDIFYGFFNPEYWALKEILNKI